MCQGYTDRGSPMEEAEMYVRFQAVYSLNQAQHRRLGCMLQNRMCHRAHG
jgi:hypothetical protein